MWQLVSNVTIGGTNCTWSKRIVLNGPTTLLGEVGASSQPGASAQSYPLPAALPPTLSGVGRAAAAAAAVPVNATGRSSQLEDANGSSSSPAVPVGAGPKGSYALRFQYTADLIHLPPDASDNYFQIRNITLGQLPQASSLRSAGWASRGLLQAGQASASLADTHPGLFTILLWSFNRCGQHAIMMHDALHKACHPVQELDSLRRCCCGGSSTLDSTSTGCRSS